MSSYDLAWHHASPHGVVAAYHIPDSPTPAPEDVFAQLCPEEREHAETLRGYRQVQFVGGRLAMRTACRQLGVRPAAILPDHHGAPALPKGLVGSISHKRTVAVAMVARARCGTLGVDIEEYGPPRLSILETILTPRELAQIGDLSEDRRWISALVRFSLKESLYKALHPLVQRYVGFHEAEVWPDLQGRARVELQLDHGEGPFHIDARFEWLYGRLLTSARLRPQPCAQQGNNATIGPAHEEKAE